MASSGIIGPDTRRVRGSVLLEREVELAAIDRAVATAAGGRGSLVVVEGAAGIGKTTLLRAACAQARDRDLRIVTARGLAFERDFPFGVVRQLFEPVRTAAPGEWPDLLHGAAALAGRAFDPGNVEPVEADIGYATTHGLFWLAANLSVRRPLVVAVDDAHWADPPSLRWLAHLASRLDGLRIMVLLAVRTGIEGQEALDELRGAATSPLLRPAPLSTASVAVLVNGRLGDESSPELCRACHEATGGNPFLLDSLVGALGGGAGTAVDRLGPEPVARAVSRRLAQLPPGAAALARAVAVLGGPAWLRDAAAVAGQELEQAARLADHLRTSGLFAPGTRVEFEHPIVRAAIYEAIPLGERAIAHAGAARLLEREGAGTERVALHLLRTEPGGRAETVNLLRAAAHDANARGAPDASATFLQRALDEPPDPARRPALLLELGLALAAGRRPDAPAALLQAVSLAAEPAARAEAALSSSRVLGIWGHHDAAISVCQEALGAGDALDPALVGRLEGELVSNALVHPAMAEEARVRTLARVADAGPTNAWRVNLAFACTIAGRPAQESLNWLAPVLAGGLGDVAPDSLAAAYVLFVLIWNDELAVAQSICDAVLDSARSRGSMSMVAHASGASSMIALRRGDLEGAASDARLALDFKLATSPPLAVAWATAHCVEALAGLGRFQEAEETAARAVARQPPPGYVHTLTLLQARGVLRCAEARFEEALGDLLEAGAGFARLGGQHPDLASWRLAAAEASAAIGRRGDAARLAEEHLALARRVGTPRIIGSALRVCAGTAEGDRAEELLAEAVGLLQKTPARIELARALADLGAVRRRAGRRREARDPLLRAVRRRAGRRREARDPLLRAAELADGAGAQQVAARVRAELLASGARPRRTALTGPAALTSAERRIADLAAEGLTNRQIAQRLFVTPPTVETHLRHVFQKLDIRSRNALPRELGARELT